ncbi:MAG TPA: nucleoside triphosphate pyrophosphohydrolase [Bauldia sp.]|nr:nucleoside triphosphate pyrophosphohydrolase [Bauldia sp.]
MKPSRDIERLIEIMAALRHPVTGCPWDLEQTFSTIAPYTVEEAHEVAEAIARNDMVDLRDELGDLLLQVVYHARLAEEGGAFSFPDVVEAITTKLVRRHPHVFGDADARAAPVAKAQWERIKAEEKAARRAERGEHEPSGLLHGVGRGLPPLTRALRLQEKASTVGFDWQDPRAVIAKLREEITEIEEVLAETVPSEDRLEDEVGDLLFVVVNLARHLKVDPEQALRRTNAKVETRFSAIESALAKTGRTPADASLDEMEALWQEAKRSTKTEEKRAD